MTGHMPLVPAPGCGEAYFLFTFTLPALFYALAIASYFSATREIIVISNQPTLDIIHLESNCSGPIVGAQQRNKSPPSATPSEILALGRLVSTKATVAQRLHTLLEAHTGDHVLSQAVRKGKVFPLVSARNPADG